MAISSAIIVLGGKTQIRIVQRTVAFEFPRIRISRKIIVSPLNEAADVVGRFPGTP